MLLYKFNQSTYSCIIWSRDHNNTCHCLVIHFSLPSCLSPPSSGPPDSTSLISLNHLCCQHLFVPFSSPLLLFCYSLLLLFCFLKILRSFLHPAELKITNHRQSAWFLCRNVGSQWALEQAKYNLVNEYMLVGVTEELEDFVMMLEAALPRFFKGATELYKTGATGFCLCFTQHWNNTPIKAASWLAILKCLCLCAVIAYKQF